MYIWRWSLHLSVTQLLCYFLPSPVYSWKNIPDSDFKIFLYTPSYIKHYKLNQHFQVAWWFYGSSSVKAPPGCIKMQQARHDFFNVPWSWSLCLLLCLLLQSKPDGFSWGILALLIALQDRGLRFRLSTIATVYTELSNYALEQINLFSNLTAHQVHPIPMSLLITQQYESPTYRQNILHIFGNEKVELLWVKWHTCTKEKSGLTELETHRKYLITNIKCLFLSTALFLHFNNPEAKGV